MRSSLARQLMVVSKYSYPGLFATPRILPKAGKYILPRDKGIKYTDRCLRRWNGRLLTRVFRVPFATQVKEQ